MRVSQDMISGILLVLGLGARFVRSFGICGRFISYPCKAAAAGRQERQGVCGTTSSTFAWESGMLLNRAVRLRTPTGAGPD